MNFSFGMSFSTHCSDLYNSLKFFWFESTVLFKCLQLICIEQAPLGVHRKCGWAKAGCRLNSDVKLVRCQHGVGHINSNSTNSTPPPDYEIHCLPVLVVRGKRMQLTMGSSVHPVDVCRKSDCCHGHARFHMWVRFYLSNVRFTSQKLSFAEARATFQPIINSLRGGAIMSSLVMFLPCRWIH